MRRNSPGTIRADEGTVEELFSEEKPGDLTANGRLRPAGVPGPDRLEEAFTHLVAESKPGGQAAFRAERAERLGPALEGLAACVPWPEL
jgi:hypothetical protein